MVINLLISLTPVVVFVVAALATQPRWSLGASLVLGGPLVACLLVFAASLAASQISGEIGALSLRGFFWLSVTFLAFYFAYALYPRGTLIAAACLIAGVWCVRLTDPRLRNRYRLGLGVLFGGLIGGLFAFAARSLYGFGLIASDSALVAPRAGPAVFAIYWVTGAVDGLLVAYFDVAHIGIFRSQAERGVNAST
jgi:hypothetical protein